MPGSYPPPQLARLQAILLLGGVYYVIGKAGLLLATAHPVACKKQQVCGRSAVHLI